MRIGLVIHSGRDPSLDAAVTGARHLADLGAEVVAAPPDGSDELPAEIVPADRFCEGLDMAVSFGGDGTFLRAAHLCRDSGVPVLGVNLGRLGFLAEVETDGLKEAMEAVTEGSYTVEERATLRVTVGSPDGRAVHRGWALNEVSVEKTARQRLLHMDVHVSDALFAGVPADALVVATATGSTAYALSAGGPIVSPEVDATLVVPVAPHTLFDRTLVAGPDERVRVELHTDQAPAIVSCDGRSPVEVPAGGEITAVGRGEPVRLVRVDGPDFYGLVRHKFGLE